MRKLIAWGQYALALLGTSLGNFGLLNCLPGLVQGADDIRAGVVSGFQPGGEGQDF